MKINLIGVPIFYGCDNNGTQFAPDKLREKDICNILKNGEHEVYDMGNISVPYLEPALKLKSNPCMKYFDQVLEVNENLAHSVYMSLANGYFPLVLGGDHSIGIGSISGASKKFNNLGVVWIDAHGDCNTCEISTSYNIHGMPLAFATGYGSDKFTNLYFDGKKVESKNVFHIGGRDIDDDEEALMNSTDMNIYNGELLHKKGLDFVIEDILQKAKENDIDALHVSFDIDFMDASIVPGTGTKVSEGFDKNTAISILRKLLQSGLVASMDVVELNTVLDENDVTANLTVEVIKEVFKN